MLHITLLHTTLPHIALHITLPLSHQVSAVLKNTCAHSPYRNTDHSLNVLTWKINGSREEPEGRPHAFILRNSVHS